MNDNELRSLLDGAGVVPRTGDTSVLLDSLVERIDAGGADVAVAPVPPIAAGETADVIALNGRRPSPAGARARVGKVSARAASIGVAGWIAIGTGAAIAAAATTSWLIRAIDPAPVPEPVPSVAPAPDSEHDGAPDADEDWVIAGTEDSSPIEAVSQRAPDWSAPRPILDGHDLTGEDDTALPESSGDGQGEPGVESAETPPNGSADAYDAQRAEPQADPQEPAGDEGASEHVPDVDIDRGDVSVDIDLSDITDPVKDAVKDGVGAVDEGLDDLVEEVIPPGPLADTVAPVIGAVDVSGLVAWALDSLLCASEGSVGVAVTDNVGVTHVSVRVQTVGGLNVTVPLVLSNSGRWTGILPTVSLLDLGSLGNAVSITVEARDAAGNISTAQRSVTLSLGSCLG